MATHGGTSTEPKLTVVYSTSCGVPLLPSVPECYLVTTLDRAGVMARTRLFRSKVVHVCARTHFVVASSALPPEADSLALYRAVFHLVATRRGAGATCDRSAPVLVLRQTVLPPPRVDGDLAGCFGEVHRFVTRHVDSGVVSLGSVGRMQRVGRSDMYRVHGAICLCHALVFSRESMRILARLPHTRPFSLEAALTNLPVYTYHTALLRCEVTRGAPLPPLVRRLMGTQRGWDMVHRVGRHPECFAVASVIVSITLVFSICLAVVPTRVHCTHTTRPRAFLRR